MKTRGLGPVLGIFALTFGGCSAGDTMANPRTASHDGGTGGTLATTGGTTGTGGHSAGATGGTLATTGSTTGTGGHFAGATGGTTGATGGASSGTAGTTDSTTNTTGTQCPLAAPTWAAPSVPSPVVCAGEAPPPVGKWLDDFEGDTFDATVSGWNIAADTTNGKCVVPEGGGAAGTTSLAPWGSHDVGSHNGLHLQAYMGCPAPEGSNNWGAQWQFQTEPKKTGRSAFDLRSYTGMVIWARLSGAPGKGNMTAAFMTPQTTIADFGGDGTCGTAASPALCFGYYYAPAKVAQPCWAPIVVKFSDLQPMGPAPAGGFDQAHVFGLQLAASAWDTAAKMNFPVDVLIDDVYFY
jgi:hypothetical protein